MVSARSMCPMNKLVINPIRFNTYLSGVFVIARLSFDAIKYLITKNSSRIMLLAIIKDANE